MYYVILKIKLSYFIFVDFKFGPVFFNVLDNLLKLSRVNCKFYLQNVELCKTC